MDFLLLSFLNSNQKEEPGLKEKLMPVVGALGLVSMVCIVYNAQVETQSNLLKNYSKTTSTATVLSSNLQSNEVQFLIDNNTVTMKESPLSSQEDRIKSFGLYHEFAKSKTPICAQYFQPNSTNPPKSQTPLIIDFQSGPCK
jgi:cytoskeletal protein RodZ